MRFAVGAELALPVGAGTEDFGNGVDRVDPQLNPVAIAEAGGQNPDDGNGLVVEGDGFADDGEVAAEMALPEAIGKDRDARGAESSVGREKGAPEDRLNAKQRKTGVDATMAGMRSAGPRPVRLK